MVEREHEPGCSRRGWSIHRRRGGLRGESAPPGPVGSATDEDLPSGGAAAGRDTQNRAGGGGPAGFDFPRGRPGGGGGGQNGFFGRPSSPDYPRRGRGAGPENRR